MEFEGQYLTYLEYKALGGTLGQTPFDLLEYEARKIINVRTQNRLVGVTEIPDEVKMCVYHLIDKIDKYAKVTDEVKNVSSENIDGYSVSYLQPTQITDVIEAKYDVLNDVMLNDLYGVAVDGTAILYAGVI